MGHNLGTESFIEAIKEEIAEAEQLAEKPFSDLLSTDKSLTLQWVDLVLEGCSGYRLQHENDSAMTGNGILPVHRSFSSLCSAFATGGGMLGIGTVGYTYILEKAGLRFRCCRVRAHLDPRYKPTSRHAAAVV